jgi:chromosome partitioning protein
LKKRIPRAESLNQAGLAYELIFDTHSSAAVAGELRALAQELAERLGLRFGETRKSTTGDFVQTCSS